MSAEESQIESSSNDQNSEPQSGEVLGWRTILASAVLLLIPPVIPLVAATQAPAGQNVAMLIGLSVTVLLLNLLLIRVLIRWFRTLREE